MKILSMWLVATMALLANPAHADSAAALPQFEVDAFWPKPLPNKWILGQVSGIATDRHDPDAVISVGGNAGDPESICSAAASARTHRPQTAAAQQRRRHAQGWRRAPS